MTALPLLVSLTVDDLRALIREELAAALAANAGSRATPAPLLDKRELARILGSSTVTITRLEGEGLPRIFVGQSPRYDLEAVRSWLIERGPKPTTAAAAAAPAMIGGVQLGEVRLLSRPRKGGA